MNCVEIAHCLLYKETMSNNFQISQTFNLGDQVWSETFTFTAVCFVVQILCDFNMFILLIVPFSLKQFRHSDYQFLQPCIFQSIISTIHDFILQMCYRWNHLADMKLSLENEDKIISCHCTRAFIKSVSFYANLSLEYDQQILLIIHLLN